MSKKPIPAVRVQANVSQGRVEVSFSNVGLSLDVRTADDVALAILDAVCMIQGAPSALDGRLSNILDRKQMLLDNLRPHVGKAGHQRPRLRLIQGGRS